MNEQLTTALLVLLVGMITVFVVLALVVLSGRLLISVVNRYTPEKKYKKSVRTNPTFIPPKSTELSNAKVAAIVATVQQVTGGKGRITAIKKI